MLFIQGRFHIRCILDDALVVTQNVSGFSLWHRDAEATQLEAQMLDCLQTSLERNELGRKCACFHGLLTFAIPDYGCSIQEDYESRV